MRQRARNWSGRYFQWLQKVELEHVADRVVFVDCMAEVTAAGERITRLEAAPGRSRQPLAVSNRAPIDGLRRCGPH
jgi:hypothetical protein